jgi:hypothetical protein
MKELYSMQQLADVLGVSKQAVYLADKERRIEEADYITGGKIKGWTPEQVERIKNTYIRRNL